MNGFEQNQHTRFRVNTIRTCQRLRGFFGIPFVYNDVQHHEFRLIKVFAITLAERPSSGAMPHYPNWLNTNNSADADVAEIGAS